MPPAAPPRPRPIRCEIVYHVVRPHVSQLFTGLELLAAAGLVRLSQRRMRPAEFDAIVPWREHVTVLVDGRRVFYDLHDGGDINAAAAATCDAYFKRSYDAARITPGVASRVHPYGLNYEVYPGRLSWRELARIARVRDDAAVRRRALVLALGQVAPPGLGPFVPTVRTMSAPPSPDAPPRVLFAVRAWDPAGNPGLTPVQVEYWHELNRMRARCVRALRAEFGPAFLGGFMHTPYAARHFPDALLADDTMAAKRRYVALLHDHAIGVATTGLHGSTGWKLAEYVAMSRAIVSEPLEYALPGGFAAGTHYLQFATADECVARVRSLVDDAGLRARMMHANHAYYDAHVRPDALVLRTLHIATQRTPAGPEPAVA